MAKPANLIKSQKSQAFLFILATLVIYFILARPEDYARDVVVLGDYTYLADSQGGLIIIDTINKENPITFSTITSQGSANALVYSNGLVFLADGRGGVRLFNVSDPANPVEISALPISNALDVSTFGNQVFVAGDREGLVIFDVSDPVNPIKSKTIPIKDRARTVATNGSVVLVGDRRKSIHIILPFNDNPQTGSMDVGATVNDIAISGNYGYLAAGAKGLVVINFSDTANPVKAGEYPNANDALGISLESNHGIISNGNSGVILVDLSNPSQITKIGSQDTIGTANRTQKSGDYFYVADGYDGLSIIAAELNYKISSPVSSSTELKVLSLAKQGNILYLAAGDKGVYAVDISSTVSPVDIGSFKTNGTASAIALEGDLAYVADQLGGLTLLDVSNPRQIKQYTNIPTAGETNDVAVSRGFAYLAEGSGGFRIVDFTQPTNPVQTGQVSTPGTAVGITVLGSYAYVAVGDAGLRIISISDPYAPREVGSINTPGFAQDVSVQAVNRVAAQNTGSDPYAPSLQDPNTKIYAYVADQKQGVRIIDVTNPSKPIEIKSLTFPGTVQSVLAVREYAYAASNVNGVRILDITDPSKAYLLTEFDTPGEARNTIFDSSILYVADFNRGARFFNMTNLLLPVQAGFYDAPLASTYVAITQSNAFTVDGQQSFWSFPAQLGADRPASGYYDTSGVPNQFVINGNTVYIANGLAGLTLLDISDPKSPYLIRRVDTPGFSYSVSLSADKAYAYVADGYEGLRVINVSNPVNAQEAGSIPIAGLSLAAVPNANYVFVAADSGGLVVVRVDNPALPTKVSTYLEIGSARALAIQNNYAYVGTAGGGLYILDINHPLEIVKLGYFATRAEVRSITLAQNYAFLSEGDQGIQIIDVSNPVQPYQFGSSTEVGTALSTAIGKLGESGGGYQIYLANDLQGIRMYNVGEVAIFQTSAIYQTEGTATLEQIMRYFLSFGNQPAALQAKVFASISQVFVDFIIILPIMVFFWLALVAQFALPVQTWGERRKAYDRLFDYLFGRHGPAIHIKEGKVIQHIGEEKRRGAGVALVDLSSAVVLEGGSRKAARSRKSIFRGTKKDAKADNSGSAKPKQSSIRVEGPGIVFTYPNERLVGVVDLRPQFRGRADVRGYTRDGLEVESNIFVIFTLGQPPQVLRVAYQGERKPENLRVVTLEDEPSLVLTREGGPVRKINKIKTLSDELDYADQEEIHRYASTYRPPILQAPAENPIEEEASSPFSLIPEHVFSAIYSQAQDVNDNKPSDWRELPGFVAADLFRQFLAEEVYDDLYQPAKPEEGRLGVVKRKFTSQVRNMGILSYQFVERVDGEPISEGDIWDEAELIIHPIQELRNPKILRARGIKVITAGFSELIPHPEVHEQRVQYWGADWERDAQTTLSEFEYLATQIRTKARIETEKLISQYLLEILKLDNEYTKEALAIRILQELETVSSDPATRQLLPSDTLNTLNNMHNWLLSGDK